MCFQTTSYDILTVTLDALGINIRVLYMHIQANSYSAQTVTQDALDMNIHVNSYAYSD